MAEKQITMEQVSNWVGNQGYADKRDAWMLEILTEIANGWYDPEQLRIDILEYND